VRDGHDVRNTPFDSEHHGKREPLETRVLINVVKTRASLVFLRNTVNSRSDRVFKIQGRLATPLCISSEGLVIVQDSIRTKGDLNHGCQPAHANAIGLRPKS